MIPFLDRVRVPLLPLLLELCEKRSTIGRCRNPPWSPLSTESFPFRSEHFRQSAANGKMLVKALGAVVEFQKSCNGHGYDSSKALHTSIHIIFSENQKMFFSFVGNEISMLKKAAHTEPKHLLLIVAIKNHGCA